MVASGIKDIGEWLQGLGLGRYEVNFREHDIGVDLLPELTEADLRRLGVAMGSRKRMLRAIAQLETAEPSSVSQPAAAAVERRPIMVLSCRFEASSLPPQFDVEDWRDLYGGCVHEAQAIVARFGGRGQPELGDSLMAMFGYPQAQENDAERAVRAALSIQLAIERLNARSVPAVPKVTARIGIECGKVVVNSKGGVFGKATSVAARVQATADPGAVFVTPDVLRQVPGLFVAEDRGPHDLKGVSGQLKLYCIHRVASGRTPDKARSLTAFVGRRSELDLLARSWERARSGGGQFVLIVGEPGMGKSRLLAEFRASLSEIRHTWVHYKGAPLLQGSKFYPITEWAHRRFDSATPPAERLAELEKTLTLIGLDAESIAPLVAPLVDIALPPDRVLPLDPDELLLRQLGAAASWALAGARTQPAIIAFEDVQWANSASLALLARLADEGDRAPLLIVATARPEFCAPWPSRAHHALLELAPLDCDDVRLRARTLAAPCELSERDADLVSRRSDGVPLFVEEITRQVLERGAKSNPLAIPASLQQSLAARLDRLGEAREVAEIAAVLGRDFEYTLLRDLADLPEPSLKASLERLIEAQILVATGLPPNSAYRFKYVLIRDAAYENLLRSKQQVLHLRAAELLRQSACAGPALNAIARHLAQADRARQPIEDTAEDHTPGLAS